MNQIDYITKESEGCPETGEKYTTVFTLNGYEC